jgi:hypothetical protein
MLRFVRTAALTMAGFGAVAGWLALAEAQWSPSQAQTVQADQSNDEGGSKAKSKSARKSAKGKAAGDDANAAPVDAEASLDQARRALAEGKAETAFGLADQVVKNAKKDPRNTARALAVRGEAHLRQGRPAEALADLESALWVKGGLAGAEREAAMTARANALQQAGLASSSAGSNTRSGANQVVDAGDSAARRTRDGGAAKAGADEAPSTATAPSSGLGGFFSNIFGGGSSKAKPDEERAGRSSWTTATNAPARPVEPAISSSEPQRNEEPARKPPASAAAKTARVTTAIAAPAPLAPPTAGAYRVQLAAVRSRSEAEAMAQSVRKTEATVLGTRNFEIIEETYGNMGHFYRVRIGQFDHPTEAMAVCASLRQKRIDCMMLDQ